MSIQSDTDHFDAVRFESLMLTWSGKNGKRGRQSLKRFPTEAAAIKALATKRRAAEKKLAP